MTYCIFSPQYLPTPGGVERYSFYLARQLRLAGHKVLIVTSSLPGLPLQEANEDGVQVFRIPSWPLLQGRMPVAKCGALQYLTKLLKPYAIDRIVVQTHLYTLSLVGMRYAVKNKIPFLTIGHGSGYVGAANRLVSLAESCYENCMMRRAKRLCTQFYAVSQAAGAWLMHFGISCNGILYNAVEVDEIARLLAADSKNYRDDFSLPAQTPLVLFAGRLLREKGLVQLVEAMQTVFVQTGAHLVVAGDGPLYETLLLQPKPYLHLLGNINRQELMPLMAQCNIFCLPSDAEGFPTSVMEAAACKCYVVTAPYGGAKELINGSQYGMVMPDNKKESIKKALLDALQRPMQCDAAAQRAYERLCDHFTWKATCEALEEAFATFDAL